MENLTNSAIECKTVRIYPEDAERLYGKSKGNRTINRSRVTEYANLMASGKWELNGESIILDENGDVSDGHHRLLACIKANTPFDTILITGVPRKTWTTIDQGKSRSMGDVFGIAGVTDSLVKAAIVGKHMLLKDQLKSLDEGSYSKLRKKHTPEDLLTIYLDSRLIYDCCSYIGSTAVKNGLKGICGASIIGAVSALLIISLEHPVKTVSTFFEMLASSGKPMYKQARNMIAATSRNVEKIEVINKAWNMYCNKEEDVTIVAFFR